MAVTSAAAIAKQLGGRVGGTTTQEKAAYNAQANRGTSALGGNIGASAGNNLQLVQSKAGLPTSGGGGGGSVAGGGGQASPQQQSQGPNQDDINNAINDLYNSSYDYLNQAEGALRADLPNVLNEAQSNYNTNAALLGNQRTSANNQFGLQTDQAAHQNENALSAARRLYNELQTGYQQRFGGSSSAGEAAYQLAGNEQQRQQGQLGQQYNNTLQQIGVQKQDVEDKYQSGLLQLEQQKQGAINTANRDFQQKLLDINNNRAQIGAAKAQARLQALQELRNQVYTINLQNQQFQQALDLQRQQSGQALSSYATQAQTGVTGGQTAVNSFSNQPGITSNMQTNNTTSQQNPALTGYVSPQSTRNPQDQFYNQFLPNLQASR